MVNSEVGLQECIVFMSFSNFNLDNLSYLTKKKKTDNNFGHSSEQREAWLSNPTMSKKQELLLVNFINNILIII
jgi:hypothetical protein